MNEDKRKDKLMRQGSGLAALSIILVVTALVLGVALIDASLVMKNKPCKCINPKNKPIIKT